MSVSIKNKPSVTQKSLLKPKLIDKDSLNIKYIEGRGKSLAMMKEVEDSEETYKRGTRDRY